MTEQEARERCAKLGAESPERSTHSWIPKKNPAGDWSVVKLAVPSPKTPETVTTEPSENQSAKDDPRTAMEQSFPPWGAGI